jgi:hypothetical protein
MNEKLQKITKSEIFLIRTTYHYIQTACPYTVFLSKLPIDYIPVSVVTRSYVQR